jgi:predicted nuclease of predicted toxin-antitoxin system
VAREIRFHLDESAPVAVALALRQRGIDATTPEDVGLLSATDEEHVAFASSDNRVIFTQDVDFLAIHQSGVPHAGMVYCQQQTRTIGHIVRRLVQIWELCEAQEMAGRVEFI